MKKRNRSMLAVLVAVLVSAPAFAQTGATSTPFWTGMKDAPSFEGAMDARPTHARTVLDQLLAVKGARTVDLVADFLGRPFNPAAWEAWLNREEP